MISRDCIITVNGNESTLDGDIYLYKYDKNIQLYFTIINSKYMYDNDDSNNLIKSMQATYAQVKFKKAHAGDVKIEFDIQPTINGAVLLTITEELTDEDVELGDYTIQIRLLDANKNSVVTLPPVESCIHILAPLFEKLGADTNEVNEAEVNKAVARYAAPLSATTEDGTFNSKTWVDGDKITTAELNRMEQGIKNNSTQLKDIENLSLAIGDDGLLYIKKQDGTLMGTGVKVSSDTDLSKVTMSINGNTLKLLNDGIEIATVDLPSNMSETDVSNLVKKGVSETNYNALDTTDKRIIGGINEVNRKCKDIANKTIVEGNKIYLAKNDGTKLDEGTILPTSETGKPYDDSAIKADIQTLKDNKINLIEDDTSMEGIDDTEFPALTTQNKKILGAINEVNTQCKEIANKIGTGKGYDDTAIKNDIQTQKARIDTFTTLQAGSTTGDAELIDGRIGADGTTYTNIGDAIRTQCGNLNTLLDIEYEPISNNRIDDSKFVGKNFDTIIGHNGNEPKTFTLAIKLKSSSITGFLKFDDGTYPNPNNGFFWYLKCSTGEIDTLSLPVQGTFVTSDNYAKYDQLVIGSWATYDKVISTLYIGDFYDSYDNFKKQAKSKAIENVYSKINNIPPEQCTFFTKVDNLLKNITLQKGYAINPSYGLPDAVTGITRTSTDYIELKDGCESTYCNTNGYIYYYDESKNFLQSVTPTNETPAGIVALPQSTTKIKYIRYTFVTEDDVTLASYWITDRGKPYENDKLYIPSTMLEGMDKTESWYKGKKICAYGDSVTEQNKWQSFVSSYFNCSFYNRGVGGTTVTQINSSTNHMSSDTRIETIPTDSDVILVFGGHNDWSYASINIGDIKTDALSESTSFKSAFALMLKKIQTRCPNAKIITMTPVGGRTEEASANQDKQFYIRDLCMTDFANAVKEVSAYYGIPCIDINANSGINTLNHTTYIADLIHPNVEGGKLIANEVINGLKRFEPIVF